MQIFALFFLMPMAGKAQKTVQFGQQVLEKIRHGSTPCFSQQEPTYARIISKEVPNTSNTLRGQIKIKIMDTLSTNAQDTVRFECAKNWLFTANLTTTNYLPQDSLILDFEIQYPTTGLPFYPVAFKVYIPFRYSSGKKTTSLALGRVYFTPYQVVELWSEEDFTELNRTWLVETSNIDTTRLAIPRAMIPVSDLNIATDTIGGRNMDDLPTRSVFVKGLAYTVPMKWTEPLPTENQGDSPDSTYTETEELEGRKGQQRFIRIFRGTVSGRLVSRITNDVGRVVDIPLSGVFIKVKDRDGWNISDVLTTGYSNANGEFFLSYISVQPSWEGRELELFLEIRSENENYDIKVKRQTHISARIFSTEFEVGQAGRNAGVIQIGNVPIDRHEFRALSWAVRGWEYVQNVGGHSLHKNLAIFPNSNSSSFNGMDGGNPQYPLIRMRVESLETEFTMYHEFGHFVMWNVQGKNRINRHGNPAFPNAPSTHFIGELLPSDFAWTEGWANGFAFIMDGAHWWEDQEYGWNLRNPLMENEFLIFRTTNNGIGNEWHLGCAIYDMWDGADKGMPLSFPTTTTPRTIGWDDGGFDEASFRFHSILSPLSQTNNPLLQNVGEYFERFKASQIPSQDCGNKSRLSRAFRENRVSIDPTNVLADGSRSFSSDIIFVTQNLQEQGLRNGNLETFSNTFQVNPNTLNFFQTTQNIDITASQSSSFINETLVVNGLATVPNSKVSLSGAIRTSPNAMQ